MCVHEAKQQPARTRLKHFSLNLPSIRRLHPLYPGLSPSETHTHTHTHAESPFTPLGNRRPLICLSGVFERFDTHFSLPQSGSFSPSVIVTVSALGFCCLQTTFFVVRRLSIVTVKGVSLVLEVAGTITTTIAPPPPPPPVAIVPVVGQSRRKLPGPNFLPSPSLSTGTYFFPLGALPVCML